MNILPTMATTVTVSEPNYSDVFNVNAASCTNIALVNQTSPGSITIVSLSVGTCAFTISDVRNRSTTVMIMPLSRTLAGSITEFAAGVSAAPFKIITGPDGNLWFTERSVNKVGRMSPSGLLTGEFALSGGAVPTGIITGGDGNLWIAERGINKIARMTTAGVITGEFTAATLPGNGPALMTATSNNLIAFTEFNGSVSATTAVGALDLNGVLQGEQSVGTGAFLNGITSGPDGNIWFTGQGNPSPGRNSENGVIRINGGGLTEFRMGGGIHGNIMITPGPDGNLWFTENGNNGGQSFNALGAMSTSGSFREFFVPNGVPQPTMNAGPPLPNGLVAGPDNNLWFCEINVGRIGVMSTGGSLLTEFATPTGGSSPTHIAVGPDGALWFTEQTVGKIGRIQ